jgi:hypothetical protein
MSFSLLVHSGQGSTNNNGFTTSSIDTSGCDLIVVAVTDFNATAVLTDSKSNTWLSTYTADTIRTPSSQIFYAKNPSVGSGHTFSISGSSNGPAAYIFGLSGSDTTANYDVAATHFVDFATTGQAGSITPTVDNEILIAVTTHQDFSGNNPTIDSGFTIADALVGAGGAHFGGSSAYLIETTATAKNPTWTQATSSLTNAGIASFKAASGGGGPTIIYPNLEHARMRGANRGILLGVR